ncbi:hypothetical protein [Eubacterium maltosivorans]|uniref:DUF1579 domain-containing protein n=1 Tax=Eubacterium maltosivorans TaxID=2041044 RepID=A0A4P9C3E8_EUBML|nr:hypothetical protein [Eubacterium maltosivorans]QCT69859.1 hypothetical protein CPZ25_000575 [Eubacterium maltosivorans]
MNHFIETLTSSGKSAELPEAYNYFGKLIGSWKLDYTDHNIACSVKGEWHFSWVLEGMAVQDVIILPSRETKTQPPHPLTEYGTTLRVYNPDTHTWDIAYGYTGRIMRLEARKQNDMVVLTNIDDERQKWVFIKIEDTHFHWQNITVKEDGEWHINADIYAERI